jgi:hypothetical protein
VRLAYGAAAPIAGIRHTTPDFCVTTYDVLSSCVVTQKPDGPLERPAHSCRSSQG